MAGSQLNFPPEIMEAVNKMETAARLLNQEMEDMKRQVSNFVNTSQSAAVTSFNALYSTWQQSGLAHNDALTQLAKAAGTSYQDITSFDNHLANKLR